MRKDLWPYGFACASGFLVWILISSFSGQTEAWDSELYLTLGIPVLGLVAGALGFIEPKRPWRWGIVQVIAAHPPQTKGRVECLFKALHKPDISTVA